MTFASCLVGTFLVTQMGTNEMILKIAVFPVDVRVHGNVVPLEDDDGGVEGVLGAEAEGQRERLALVQSVRRAQHVDRPTGKREIQCKMTLKGTEIQGGAAYRSQGFKYKSLCSSLGLFGQ